MFGISIKEIDVAELTRWQQEKDGGFRLLDVRQPHEIAAGTVPGAHPLPLHTLPLRINELNPEETLVIMCHSGARSAQACMFLAQQGFKHVYNLRGGIVAWAASGRTIARG